MPLGELRLNFEPFSSAVSDYKRELDLETAVTTVSFIAGGVKYQREYFCSNPAGLFVVKLTAGQPGRISFELSPELLQKADFSVHGNEISFHGIVSFPQLGPGGVNFTGKVSLHLKGGKIYHKGNSVFVENSDEVVLYTDIRTDFRNPDYERDCTSAIKQAAVTGYDLLKAEHIKDYSELFNRVQFCLDTKEDYTHLPVDVRWKNKKEEGNDTGLEELFFHYGRYLLIASSRPSSPLPANLQGIWNDNLACNMGWTCDYHLDINTQQNYWAANITNLHECNEPLFKYIGMLAEDGQQTARKVYGSPGWVAHTVANVWGYTAPGQGVNWGLFPTGGAWIATHLWDHYRFLQDTVFLRTTAYPVLKETALFLLDYMVECPQSGYLMTGPSTSPENSFLYEGKELSLSMMPTCDRVLVYEIFRACMESSAVLQIDADFRKDLEAAVCKLPPLQIGKRGSLQEWYIDFDLAQPNHRHSSHLLALYPFNQISPVTTPALAEAAGKSIYDQLHSEGWEDVEWSRANMICFYARLKDAPLAYESVDLLIRSFTRENLLTISPEGIAGAPYDIFVFDGNQAGIAGMAEMLVQSHEAYIEFLPALPEQWSSGSFSGLCVRGGAETSLKWKNNKVTQLTLRTTGSNEFVVKIPQELQSGHFRLNGKTFKPALSEEGCLHILLHKNELLEIDK